MNRSIEWIYDSFSMFGMNFKAWILINSLELTKSLLTLDCIMC